MAMTVGSYCKYISGECIVEVCNHAQISALYCLTKLRECVAEREREILFVFLFCLYLAAFLWPALKLCERQSVKERERKRVFSISL